MFLGHVVVIRARKDASWFGGSCLPANQSVAGAWLEG